MDLDAGLVSGHAGAYLQHVCTQAIFLALHQMIGIVLHKGGSAVAVFTHGLHDGGHSGNLPVALTAVAVALSHQVLAGKAGQLLHAIEILEGVGEGLAALSVHHLLHGDLFPGLIADGLHVVGGKVVALLVGLHQRVDLRLGDSVHGLHQLAHRPGVDLPAQLGLDLYLIALGDGHFPHVVAKAHDLQLLADGHTHSGPHPGTQALLDVLILPVTGDDLAGHPQPGGDEAVLPVAVGGLVEVHEVHVDLIVGDLTVVLGGKMAVGLLEIHKAVDPHLGGREGVAPGDDAAALVVVVGLLDYIGNLLVGLGGDLIDQLAGQVTGGIHLLHHLGGTLGYRFQDLGTVQKLAAYHKPKLSLFHIHDTITSFHISPAYRRASTAARSAGRPFLYCSMKAWKPATSSGSGVMVSTFCPAKIC